MEAPSYKEYDFSQHEAEHYEGPDRSYGLAIINPDQDKVIVIKTAQGYYGFPKGHREDGESPKEAVIREVKEEIGLEIPLEAVTDEEFKIVQEDEISEEQLNKHIAKQKAKGERPHVKEPGRFEKEVIVFLAKGDGDETPQPKEQGIAEARWVTFEEALRLMKESNSTHVGLMEQLIKVTEGESEDESEDHKSEGEPEDESEDHKSEDESEVSGGCEAFGLSMLYGFIAAAILLLVLLAVYYGWQWLSGNMTKNATENCCI
jgi:8-oxo-dGTP pyrophosphatase MutT (NUDIX family)